MDINTIEKLPKRRSVTSLDNLPKSIVKEPLPIKPEAEVLSNKKKYDIKFVSILALSVIAAIQFVFIYNYFTINQSLHNVSVIQKNEITALKNVAGSLASQKQKLTSDYNNLNNDFSALGLEFNIMQNKVSGFKDISLSKSVKINALLGELRVKDAKLEAAAAQNAILSNDLSEYGAYIRELTEKVVNNLEAQGQLINDNIELKEKLKELVVK